MACAAVHELRGFRKTRRIVRYVGGGHCGINLPAADAEQECVVQWDGSRVVLNIAPPTSSLQYNNKCGAMVYLPIFSVYDSVVSSDDTSICASHLFDALVNSCMSPNLRTRPRTTK